MPAVVRGAGPARSAPRTRTSAKQSSARPAAKSGSQAAAKLRAAQGVGLTPKGALIAAAAVLIAGIGVTLATGHRAEQLFAATGQAIDQRFAAAGFALKTIHLQGASAAAQADILKAAGVYRDQPILGIDLEAVRQRLLHVGWVKDVRVIRLLPDTIVLAVEERSMLAVWEHGGKTVVIDAAGAPVTEADPGRFPGLPLIVGAGANEAAAGILPAIASRPRLLQHLEALVRVDGRRWDLRLKDGAIIQLPAVGEEAALIQLDQLDQRARVLDLNLARIDLRDPEMVAVRPRETSAPQEVPAEGA